MTNPFENQYHLITIFILIFISVIPYINTLENDFVFDDRSQIVENRELRDASNISRFIQRPRGIKYVILLADYKIWGLNPFGYHLTNLILHALCTISLYCLFIKIFTNSRIPLITGLLFATHPVHTEAVTAIANRTDLLAMLFFIWSLSFYIMKKRSLWFYLLSIISFILALFSKEAAVVSLPIILIFYDLYFNKGERWDFLKKNSWYYVPYGLIIITFLLYIRFILSMYPASPEPRVAGLFLQQSFPSFFYTACKAFLIYIKMLFFPLNLNVDYALPLSRSLLEWKVLVSLVSLILFLILTVRMYFFSKAISFSMAWLFITLFPLSNLLFPIAHYFVAERYLYLPSVGFCLLIAIIIDKFMDIERLFFKKLSPKKTAIFMLTIILCLYLGLTINRNIDWRSNYTLWSKTVKQSPHSFRAHHNLGNVYQYQGLIDKAIEHYQIAVKLKPLDPDVYFNLGIAYQSQGFFDKAIENYWIVINLNPNDSGAHKKLGSAYHSQGLFDKAKEHYRIAKRLNIENHKR